MTDISAIGPKELSCFIEDAKELNVHTSRKYEEVTF